jgi:hypothetical protein
MGLRFVEKVRVFCLNTPMEAADSKQILGQFSEHNGNRISINFTIAPSLQFRQVVCVENDQAAQCSYRYGSELQLIWKSGRDTTNEVQFRAVSADPIILLGFAGVKMQRSFLPINLRNFETRFCMFSITAFANDHSSLQHFSRITTSSRVSKLTALWLNTVQ